jgi:hypothetical protein
MVALEANLLVLALGCPRCAALNLTMRPTQPFGLEIIRNGQSVGIWSERHGVLVFRNLASWQSRRTVATPAEAIELTITMAEQNSWLD